MTKKDIQQRTGLSWGALSNIIGQMVQDEILSVSLQKESAIGRTPSLYEIRPSRHLMAGLDINISGITAVLIDLKQRLLAKVQLELESPSREAVLRKAIQSISMLLDTEGVVASNLIGIGIAMQGNVDAKNGISTYAPYFQEWANVPLRNIFEEAFRVPVLVEHDPVCMALAERWGGSAEGVDNLLFVRLSSGIGLCMLLDGAIYKGHQGHAGELGHITVDVNGELCSCGRRGCLETVSSGTWLFKKAGTNHPVTHTMDLHQGLHWLIEQDRAGKQDVQAVLAYGGRQLGIALANLVNLMNPERIVLGGELSWEGGSYIQSALETARHMIWTGSSLNVSCSGLGDEAAAMGAAKMFIHEFHLHGLSKMFAG